MTELHPYIVNPTIILLATGLAAELLSRFIPNPTYLKVADYTLVLGTAGAILAVLTGNETIDVVATTPALLEMAENHKLFGQLTMWGAVVFTAMRFLLREERKNKRYLWMIVGGAAVAALLLFRTANLGSEMANEADLLEKGPKKERPIKKPEFR